MHELSAELRRCGEALIRIAEALSEPAPEIPETVTLDSVRAVLAEKSRLGFTAEVKELLRKYGAEKLSGLDPEKYADLKAEAEVIGNA